MACAERWTCPNGDSVVIPAAPRLGLYKQPDPYLKDSSGKRWCRTGMVYGDCEDHLLPKITPDGPLRWEAGGMNPGPRKPPVVQPALPPRPPLTMKGLDPMHLGALETSPVTVWVAEGGACSMPSLAGMVVFGLLGAHAAHRSRRAAGAMDGVFGSWLGCAAASALGLTGGISTLASLAGAYYAARVFDGSGR